MTNTPSGLEVVRQFACEPPEPDVDAADMAELLVRIDREHEKREQRGGGPNQGQAPTQ
jgi:hypothetical protein